MDEKGNRRVINFPEHLDLRLRVLARDTGLSVNFLVRRAVQGWLDAREHNGQKQGLPLDPPAADMDAAALPY